MGGIGSGNRHRFGVKRTCESLLHIDIRYMRKAGLLKPNTKGTLSWSQRGERIGWISYNCYVDYLELNFRTREVGTIDWQDVRQTVPLENKTQPFGGVRRYFNCPECAQRCLVLYSSGMFACRKCQRLTYQSQNDDIISRAQMRCRAITRRLGGDPELSEFLPRKPKGMHWKTYQRLCTAWELNQEQIENEFAVMQQRFASCF